MVLGSLSVIAEAPEDSYAHGERKGMEGFVV